MQGESRWSYVQCPSGLKKRVSPEDETQSKGQTMPPRPKPIFQRAELLDFVTLG